MPQISFDYRFGVRKPSALINLAASATPVLVFTPAGITLAAPTVVTAVGRTCRITKIWAFNEGTLTGQLEFGVGLAGAFVQRLPAIPILAGQIVTLTEDEIPNVEFEQQITATNTAAGATDIDFVIEVQEYEGGGAPV